MPFPPRPAAGAATTSNPLTPAEVERIEARLFYDIPEIRPEDVQALINDWRKKRWVLARVFELFREIEESRYVRADAVRKSTLDALKLAAGI